MKTLLMTMILTVTSPVFGSEIATYNFGINGENGNHLSNEITILENQTAKIKTIEMIIKNPFNYEVLEEETKIVDIPTKLYRDLLQDIQNLSEAELNTLTRRHICLLSSAYPAAARSLKVRRGYNSTSGDFTGELETVLTQDVCWLSNYTRPSTENMQIVAKALRAKLKTITLINL